jgi:CrcB protein
MDALTKSLFIGFGAFMGANARYWLGGWIQNRLDGSFPWQTMVINVSGSLIIGVFMELALREGWDPRWRLFFAVGVLGGFTTFSTFAYESVNMLAEKSYDWGLFYILGSASFCVLAAWLGRFGARALLGG